MTRNIRNNPGLSSYFKGEFAAYGRYQWNIKFYEFEDDCEIETAVFWAFGEHEKLKNGRYGFSAISDLLGREIESHIDGRSGGWLVIDTELRAYELKQLDAFVESSMRGLPEMLKEERAFRASEEK